MKNTPVNLEIQITLGDAYGQAWGDAIFAWLMNFDSRATRESYLRAWRQLTEYIPKHPANFTHSDMIAFKRYLTERNLSQATINAKLSAISSFYRYAVACELTEHNPCDGVKRKSVSPYGKATALNADENEHLAFIGAIDASTPQGKRDLAMMLVFLTTGVRRAVIANAQCGDIQQVGSKWYLRYVGKGDKDGRVHLAPVVLAALDDYLATRANLTADSPLFVATARGQAAAANAPHVSEYVEKPLSAQTVYNLVKKYARRAGFENITPHSLRHTVAMRLSKEATLPEIAAMLGHANTRITSVYLQHLSSANITRLTDTLASDYDELLP